MPLLYTRIYFLQERSTDGYVERKDMLNEQKIVKLKKKYTKNLLTF